MGFWWWVLVFGGISLAALCSVRLLGLRLFRKAKVLFSELGRLGAAPARSKPPLDARGPAPNRRGRRIPSRSAATEPTERLRRRLT